MAESSERGRLVGLVKGPKDYVELHGHSNVFNDGLLSPQQILDQAQRRGLSWVFIADHDSVKGSEDLIRLAASTNVKTALSEEISTDRGHLLAWGLQSRIPHGIRVEKAIDEAHAQGALVGVAHIGFKGTHSLSWADYFELLENGYEIDAIELINGGVEKVATLSRIPILRRFVVDQNSNIEGIELVARLPEELPSALVPGTDYHYRNGVGLVPMGIPRGVDVFEAIRTKQVETVWNGEVESVTVFDEVKHRILGYYLKDDRKNERNGIMGYREEPISIDDLREAA